MPRVLQAFSRLLHPGLEDPRRKRNLVLPEPFSCSSPAVPGNVVQRNGVQVYMLRNQGGDAQMSRRLKAATEYCEWEIIKEAELEINLKIEDLMKPQVFRQEGQ